MQQLPKLLSCDAVILTALPVEFQAVMAYIKGAQKIVHPQGTIYHIGNFTGEAVLLRVAVAQIGMGGVSAATETERAIQFLHPRILLFVGIGGGLKDVQLGDVVASTKVYSYESGKDEHTFNPRPELWQASYPLVQLARNEACEKAWKAYLGGGIPDPGPRVHIGALAAGAKIIASTESNLAGFLKDTYGDALAVEMEGHGFLQAIHENHDMLGLVIRGISDMLDGKADADAAGSQSRAACHAAAFAFQLLATFKFPPTHDDSATTFTSAPFSRFDFTPSRVSLEGGRDAVKGRFRAWLQRMSRFSFFQNP